MDSDWLSTSQLVNLVHIVVHFLDGHVDHLTDISNPKRLITHNLDSLIAIALHNMSPSMMSLAVDPVFRKLFNDLLTFPQILQQISNFLSKRRQDQ
jgi:hypothetical protein